jgi:hypothetical protein
MGQQASSLPAAHAQGATVAPVARPARRPRRIDALDGAGLGFDVKDPRSPQSGRTPLSSHSLKRRLGEVSAGPLPLTMDKKVEVLAAGRVQPQQSPAEQEQEPQEQQKQAGVQHTESVPAPQREVSLVSQTDESAPAGRRKLTSSADAFSPRTRDAIDGLIVLSNPNSRDSSPQQPKRRRIEAGSEIDVARDGTASAIGGAVTRLAAEVGEENLRQQGKLASRSSQTGKKSAKGKQQRMAFALVGNENSPTVMRQRVTTARKPGRGPAVAPQPKALAFNELTPLTTTMENKPAMLERRIGSTTSLRGFSFSFDNGDN